MIDKQQIVKLAYKFAMDESIRTSFPKTYHIDPVIKKGAELAKALNADEFVVSLGVLLMDISLGDAVASFKREEHVAMSCVTARAWMKSQKIDDITISKVIHCIESHHKDVEWNSLEAEICANADCYRFLHSKYFLKFFADVEKVRPGFAEEKFNEKAAILSLTLCREELAVHMTAIRKILALSKKE